MLTQDAGSFEHNDRENAFLLCLVNQHSFLFVVVAHARLFGWNNIILAIIYLNGKQHVNQLHNKMTWCVSQRREDFQGYTLYILTNHPIPRYLLSSLVWYVLLDYSQYLICDSKNLYYNTMCWDIFRDRSDNQPQTLQHVGLQWNDRIKYIHAKKCKLVLLFRYLFFFGGYWVGCFIYQCIQIISATTARMFQTKK